MNNLELEFILEREKRYLKQNPTEAEELALNYLEEFLNQREETRAIERRNRSLIADNQALTSQLADATPLIFNQQGNAHQVIQRYEKIPFPKASASATLPSFLECNQH